MLYAREGLLRVGSVSFSDALRLGGRGALLEYILSCEKEKLRSENFLRNSGIPSREEVLECVLLDVSNGSVSNMSWTNLIFFVVLAGLCGNEVFSIGVISSNGHTRLFFLQDGT